jgi:hypothetical protein
VTPPASGWSSRRRDLALGLAAMAVAAAIALLPFVQQSENPTVFLRVGQYSASRPYVERALPGPVLTNDYGHDGQQFYVIASTFPHAHDAIPFVDHIRYRFRRVLFPALVSVAPDGAPLIWTMFAVNLLAIGAAAIALSHLSRRLGGSPWVGLVAGISPALFESLQGSLADGLAFALAVWGLVLWRKHLAWALLLFTLAALTRETSLVVPAACWLVGSWRQRRWLLVPPAVFVGWAAIVAIWLPASSGTGNDSILGDAAGQLTVPFRAWAHLGWNQPGPTVGLAFLAASLFAAWVLRRRLPEVSIWLLLDAVLLVAANAGVGERPLNLARVAAMAVPAMALAVVTIRHPRLEPAVPHSTPAAGHRLGTARTTASTHAGMDD